MRMPIMDYMSAEENKYTGSFITGGGIKVWLVNGERHREDGPAILFPDGDEWWYLHGRMINQQQKKQLIRKTKIQKLLDND